SFEGGEAETFVLDGPIFKKKISIIKAEKIWKGYYGHYIIKKAKLINKN
ncbi:MAG: TIGR00289 family protein, partial [Nitrososphaerota archaeon]